MKLKNTDKLIVCHFSGGPSDGILRSDSESDDERILVESHFQLTKGGQVGKAVMGASLGVVDGKKVMKRGGQPARYRVVKTEESDVEIHIFFESFFA